MPTLMNVPIMSLVMSFASLAPVAVGAARYKRLSFPMKAFLAFCIVVCTETAAEYVLAFHKINNLFVSNASLVLEPLCIGTVYMLAIDMRSVRMVLLALMALFVCVWIPDRIFLENPNEMNEGMSIVSSIFVVIISVIALHTVARRPAGSLTGEPMFWITTANILLSTGDVFVLGLSNELLAMGVSYFTAAWTINWSLDTLSSLLFMKGLLCEGALQA